MMKNLFVVIASFLLFLPLLITCQEKHVYIVYFGEHDGLKTHQEIEDHHYSYLTTSLQQTKETAKANVLYSYKNSINGFAALLTPEEASTLSEKEEVLTVFATKPNRYSLQTTRSWKFLGLEDGKEYGKSNQIGWGSESLLQKANYGKDVIVGLLDSGVWPESRSFNDEGMGPVPLSWKGICQAGDSFSSSNCNRKLIGARYYLKEYEHYNGPVNTSIDFISPRDHDGHGSHTASTVAGREVYNVSALGGIASGTASGGAPLARVAMYKVCWPLNGTLQNGNSCFETDMLAAIDDAIGDGVDILSISIGTSELFKYTDDGIAMGALHAVKNDIVVAVAAGNSGPSPATVSNLAPWTITVAASSIDRAFSAPVVLGNGLKIKGQTVTPEKLQNKLYPLVYAGDVVEPHVRANSTGQCMPGSLSPEKTKGKIVLCFRGEGLRVGKGVEVKRAGGVGIILGNSVANGNELSLDSYVLPGTSVVADDAITILNYIKSTKKPMAQIDPVATVLDTKPAPFMAGFSSTGPNPLEPNILKPDISAPGLNILAAWSEAMPPTKLDIDHRVAQYNFDSGTSMATPHVAGIAALLKVVHPTWSNAAIRSAIMTTANVKNNQGNHLTTTAGTEANPFNYGSGHLRPTKVSDPGLVYDATYTDYLLFLCSIGENKVDRTFKCPSNPPSPSNLNHPSLAIANLNGMMTVNRTVTNVGGKRSVYTAKVESPRGFSVKLQPKILSFSKVGEKKSFTVTVKANKGSNNGKVKGEYSFGSYTWNDGLHVVRSPIVVS
ncbi:Subtilisin-like protease SBT5.6 [Thalictrum thalictroides]|uniref:Subtilisin-like protease SBT5.6 n=1 Tax=Thalictrum thalictroides TaxID=46969 RepID=A0A7J6UUM0_THATH|nr:Subtilisin-like protease SBT5.6 [Thalictrum thalictroides]